jgi:endonuclease YncB( thermonuclease family)
VCGTHKVFLIIIFLIIVFWILFYIFCKNNINSEIKNIPDNYVISVIDGDTFILANKEKVRLICVDSPEKGKPGYDEAKRFLESLILNKEVRLEKDISEKDEYNRLLRYVFVNTTNGEVFVNQEIVKQGYAKLFVFPPDIKRCGEIGNKI